MNQVDVNEFVELFMPKDAEKFVSSLFDEEEYQYTYTNIRELTHFIDSKYEDNIYLFFYNLIAREDIDERLVLVLLKIRTYCAAIEKKINESIEFHTLSGEKHSLLWWTLKMRHLDIAEYLIFCGANYIDDLYDVFNLENIISKDDQRFLLNIIEWISDHLFIISHENTYISYDCEPELYLPRIIINDICLHFMRDAIKHNYPLINNELKKCIPQTMTQIKKIRKELEDIIERAIFHGILTKKQKMIEACDNVPVELLYIVINMGRPNNTLLCYAVSHFEVDLIETLIEKGAICQGIIFPMMLQFVDPIKIGSDQRNKRELKIIEMIKILMRNGVTDPAQYLYHLEALDMEDYDEIQCLNSRNYWEFGAKRPYQMKIINPNMCYYLDTRRYNGFLETPVPVGGSNLLEKAIEFKLYTLANFLKSVGFRLDEKRQEKTLSAIKIMLSYEKISEYNLLEILRESVNCTYVKSCINTIYLSENTKSTTFLLEAIRTCKMSTFGRLRELGAVLSNEHQEALAQLLFEFIKSNDNNSVLRDKILMVHKCGINFANIYNEQGQSFLSKLTEMGCKNLIEYISSLEYYTG